MTFSRSLRPTRGRQAVADGSILPQAGTGGTRRRGNVAPSCLSNLQPLGSRNPYRLRRVRGASATSLQDEVVPRRSGLTRLLRRRAMDAPAHRFPRLSPNHSNVPARPGDSAGDSADLGDLHPDSQPADETAAAHAIAESRLTPPRRPPGGPSAPTSPTTLSRRGTSRTTVSRPMSSSPGVDDANDHPRLRSDIADRPIPGTSLPRTSHDLRRGPPWR